MDGLINENIKTEKVNTITTLEIAEMMEIRHQKIIEKLEGTKDGKTKGIIPILTEHDFVLSDYFVLSTYKDASGKSNKCYLVTKIGCDFLANKFTGEKGILFTAKYVKRFEEMEQELSNREMYIPRDYASALRLAADEYEKRMIVEKERDIAIEEKEKANEQLELQTPYVKSLVRLQRTDDTVSTKEFSDLICNDGIKIGRNKMMQLLRKKKILTKNKNKDNEPYNKYIQQGIFRVVQAESTDKYGKTHIHTATRITVKGVIYLNAKIREWLGMEKGSLSIEDINRLVKMEEEAHKYDWLDAM